VHAITGIWRVICMRCNAAASTFQRGCHWRVD
jgi:ribosomal protein L40E